MAENITTKIDSIIKDKRQSKDTVGQAEELKKIIGTTKQVPEKLKESILNNESTSDAVDIMKTYVNNK